MKWNYIHKKEDLPQERGEYLISYHVTKRENATAQAYYAPDEGDLEAIPFEDNGDGISEVFYDMENIYFCLHDTFAHVYAWAKMPKPAK